MNSVCDDERVVRLTEREALANVRAVLELCAAGELRCSDKTNRPTAATIRTIDAHLVHGDFYADERIATVAWPLLVQAGGLAKLDGTRLQLTPKGRVALGKPAAEAVRQLWQRWLTHAVIDEFSRIEQIKGQRARNVLTAAKPRRQTVAVALADCPLGEWISRTTCSRRCAAAASARPSRAARGRCGSCTWKIRITAASVTTAIMIGRCWKAATPWRCCSSMPARWG